jgi:adenine-specific DNA-methyltransferase
VVDYMVGMLPSTQRILEPSVGAGAFLDKLPINTVGLEIDADLCTDSRTLCLDFFDYPLSEQFDAVIMNPPYLRAKHIPEDTRSKLGNALSGHANLAHHFMLKAMSHVGLGGIIVAILPEDIFRATGAVVLNKQLHATGTITHLVKFKKAPFLPAISQEAIIVKWVKGDFSYITEVTTLG